MSNATAQEQYLLELINEARINPMANAARYISSYENPSSPDSRIQTAFKQFGVNGPALRAAYAGLTPVAPVAWNETLAQMASAHNQSMIKFDTQSHQTPDEGTLGQRATAAFAAKSKVVRYGTYLMTRDFYAAASVLMVLFGLTRLLLPIYAVAAMIWLAFVVMFLFHQRARDRAVAAD